MSKVLIKTMMSELGAIIPQNELDKIAEEFIRANGGIPAQKGYPGPDKYTPDFPAC